jgi:hypothetical protein
MRDLWGCVVSVCCEQSEIVRVCVVLLALLVHNVVERAVRIVVGLLPRAQVRLGLYTCPIARARPR